MVIKKIHVEKEPNDATHKHTSCQRIIGHTLLFFICVCLSVSRQGVWGGDVAVNCFSDCVFAREREREKKERGRHTESVRVCVRM